MTTDVDALILAMSAIKDAINHVRDLYNLPNGWLNDDFADTVSYSDKLAQFSKYYRTFSNTVTVRTISAEYLIAMKLRSGRQYKSDLSDILGILLEQKNKGQPLSMELIQKAVADLYGEWNSLPESSQIFIESVMSHDDFEALYSQIASIEKETRENLVLFEKAYPGIAKQSNINEITEGLQKKTARESVLELLREKQGYRRKE